MRQITRALESKANHTLPDEFFHDTLDEHFTEEETVQQLQTAINKGRYARASSITIPRLASSIFPEPGGIGG